MEYLYLILIGFFAFFLKGITGTGTTTVIVALCSLIMDPKETIVLASFINIFGGLTMIRVDPVPLSGKYWGPVALLMIIGSVLGAIALKYIPRHEFQLLLGGVFLLAALWFFFRIPRLRNNSEPPGKAGAMDLGIGGLAGFCGGFIGIQAPPLVLHFGRSLDKRYLRRFLVLIFIPAAMAQTATYVINGLFQEKILIRGLIVIPSMLAGVYLGNHIFHRISENLFRRALGLLLAVISARLLWKGIG